MNQTAYTIDETNYPLVKVRWHQDANDEVFRAYLKDMETLFAKNQQVAVTYFTPSHVNIPAEQRLQMSRWLRDNEAMLKRCVVANCFVTSSAMMTVFLRAIFIFAPPKQAYKITTSEKEAESWCRSMLAQHTQAKAS